MKDKFSGYEVLDTTPQKDYASMADVLLETNSVDMEVNNLFSLFYFVISRHSKLEGRDDFKPLFARVDDSGWYGFLDDMDNFELEMENAVYFIKPLLSEVVEYSGEYGFSKEPRKERFKRVYEDMRRLFELLKKIEMAKQPTKDSIEKSAAYGAGAVPVGERVVRKGNKELEIGDSVSPCLKPSLVKIAKLVLTVGLPYSGKSTWAQSMIKQGWIVVCPDMVRFALHGQRFAGPAEPLVWYVVESMVLSLKMAGHDKIILDATSNTKKRREVWGKYVGKGLDVRYKLFDTPASVCIERAKKKGDMEIIPVIERMNQEKEGVKGEGIFPFES